MNWWDKDAVEDGTGFQAEQVSFEAKGSWGWWDVYKSGYMFALDRVTRQVTAVHLEQIALGSVMPSTWLNHACSGILVPCCIKIRSLETPQLLWRGNYKITRIREECMWGKKGGVGRVSVWKKREKRARVIKKEKKKECGSKFPFTSLPIVTLWTLWTALNERVVMNVVIILRVSRPGLFLSALSSMAYASTLQRNAAA